MKRIIWGSQTNPGILREIIRKIVLKSNFLTKLYRNTFKPEFNYEKWIRKVEQPFINSIDFQQELKNYKYKPKFSFLIPVYTVEPMLLQKCIESIQNQYYDNWEICLHIDNPPRNKEENIKLLQKLAQKDKRVVFSVGEKRKNISISTNNARKLASGEYLILMDSDDIIPQYALFFIVQALNKNQNLEFIYSDEDKLTVEDSETYRGRRVAPLFRPNWDRDMLREMMYTTHLSVYKAELFDKAGGLRKGLEGSQDYDLILRASELISDEKILHIPLVLYHWRMIPGSTAVKLESEEKPLVIESANKAAKDAIKRRNLNATLIEGSTPLSHRIKFDIESSPRISVIIPTYNQHKILMRCLESVKEKTSYNNYDIYVIDNNSDNPESVKYLNKLRNQATDDQRLTVLSYDKPYNYSAINNWAVKHIKDKEKDHQILFLNNDTEILNRGWMKALLEYSQKDYVGAVGAMLLYPNKQIQHAGIFLVQDEEGKPKILENHKYFSFEEVGYMTRIHIAQQMSAVTGACLMIKKTLFNKVGGFNEKNLPVDYNDIELCLKLIELGYKNIYTPYAKLIHHEALTRGKHNKRVISERIEKAAGYMAKHWSSYFYADPHYNINLTRKKTNFGLRYNSQYLLEYYEKKLKE